MNQNFVEYVKSHIKEYLPMEYQNAVISVNEVTKSNDRMLTGLTILLPGERAAPTIYLEALAEQVERGMPLDTAMKQIAQIQLENYNRVPLDISILENYEAIRPMLAVQMCDPETNQEYLKGRERFRYKKAVILMGANATGKTSLGKALLRIFGYMTDGNPTPLYDMVAGDKGYFSIDFVNGDYRLQRLSAQIDASNQEIDIQYQTADIDTMDSYEKCVKKLKDQTIEATRTTTALKKLVGAVRYRFTYPEIEKSLKLTGANKSILLKTLRAVIGTLDPTLQDVSLSRDLKDTFIIRRGGTEIIIQEGKLLNREILSSGTAEGIDVAMFLAAMATKESSFYYCDEHFSYIQSDIEKRIFGIMLDRVGDDEQLIFTTHNTDMLDLNLPKHSYVFLRKHLEEGMYQVSAVSASDVLKRNTDSLRCAVENDVFASLPQDSLLDELEMGWEDEQ